MRKILISFLLLLIFVACKLSAQNTLYVSLSGSNSPPYASLMTAATSIQTAIDAAVNNDLILVNDGIYTLTASISVSKAITIRSINGATVTNINGNNAIRCIYINNVNAIIDGFRISNGRNLSGFGGGVQCDNGTVQNCIIENNASRDGGGVALDNSGMVLNCIIRNNSADWGGGVRCFNGTVRGCLITGNTATPHGGGINIWSRGTVQNCTITNNSATDGSGIRLWNNGTVENSIIYFNSGSSDYIINSGAGNSLSYSCATPLYAGTGNIADNPQFVNAVAGDFHLSSTSPLINSGLNQIWMTGSRDLDGYDRIFNSAVDIGAYEFTITNYSIEANVTGGNGTIHPSGNVIVPRNGDQTFTITPELGYHIADVLVDGLSVGPVPNHTFDNVLANHTISASFAINTYSLTTTSVNGTVTKNPDQANYQHGSSVQLTALPIAGYSFTGWSGDASGSENPLTIIMDDNKNITANFAINTYILTITSINGSVTKNPNQANYSHGSSVQLTAIPTAGYLFSGWSGDASGTANPLTITMDGNKNITATFTVDNNTYITIGSGSGVAGSSVTIPVGVHFGSDGRIPPYLLQGKIIYDPLKLQYRSNAIGALLTSANWTFTCYSSTAGQIEFISTGSNSISTNGILFNLNFDIISNIAGPTQITSQTSYWLSNGSSTPPIFNSINSATINITSQSTSAMIGDADLNFRVDFNDAVAIINSIFDISTLSDQGLINADVDHNGRITLADGIYVILYNVFGDWNYVLSLLSLDPQADLSVASPQKDDTNIVIPFLIKNADNVRSVEVTVEYDPVKVSYQSFNCVMNSTNVISKAALVKPGLAKFVIASSELLNTNFSIGSMTLKSIGNESSNSCAIKTRYKINDGNEITGPSINSNVTDVSDDAEKIPTIFTLEQNYPNPFNPSTSIKVHVAQDGYYSLNVYNLLGEKVGELINREMKPGVYKFTFEAKDLPSGIYFYKFTGRNISLVRKMLLLR